MSMDKSSQIEMLRKEHTIAVDKYDFDRAELIERQIQRLRTEISRDFERSQSHVQDLDLDQQMEKIRGTSSKIDAHMMEKRIQIQKRFHERFSELQTLHTQQLTDLSLEHTAALEREAQRPIAEVDALLADSRRNGREHRYVEARAIYQQAMALKSRVLAERQNECNDKYTRLERKLKERQQKEMKLLHEKEESAVSDLNLKHNRKTTMVDNRMRVKEIKAEQQKAFEKNASTRLKTLRLHSSQRRSASVTRSRPKAVM